LNKWFEGHLLSRALGTSQLHCAEEILL
jgi:hypothetical protein